MRKEPNEKLTMRVQVPDHLDRLENGGGGGYLERGDISDRVVTAKLFVSYQGGGTATSAEDVSISIEAPAPFVVDQPTVALGTVKGADGAASTPMVVCMLVFVYV